MTTRYLICGGRDFANEPMLDRALSALILHPKESVIIHGGATGADIMAAAWGERRGASVYAVPANWKDHGKAAGPVRNAIMLRDFYPDVVIAFPGGNGTDDMIDKARKARLVVIKVVA